MYLYQLSQQTITPSGIKIYDVLRIFTGDNPARQFESGQQRGGNYSCLCGIHVNDHKNLACAFTNRTISLTDRFEHFKKGIMWKGFSMKNINPLSNLKKSELIKELDHRKLESYDDMNKNELQSILTETMRGMNRPAALLCPSLINNEPVSKVNCEHYEINTFEPLHDITNVVQNLLTELPHHMESPELQKQYQKFSDLIIGV